MQGTVPLSTRPLGNTGLQVPILGLGTAQAGFRLADSEAATLFHRAIDLGVTFLDTAPTYGDAHRKLNPVLRERRGEVLLATKAGVDTAQEALESLERSLDTLGVDHVDIAYVHNIGSRDVGRVIAEGGSIAGMREAQRQGLTRFVGFTAHNRPKEAARVLQAVTVDVVMLAMNCADRFTYDFETQIRPVASDRGVGVIAMKVFGGAEGMKYETALPSAMEDGGHADYPAAMRYALGLAGVAIAVVGTGSLDELDQNVALARGCAELPTHASAAQAAAAAGPDVGSAGQALAERWGDHFGPR